VSRRLDLRLKKPFYSPRGRTSHCIFFGPESLVFQDRSLRAKWTEAGVSGQEDRSLRAMEIIRQKKKPPPPLLRRATPLKKEARSLGPESPVPDTKSPVFAHQSLWSGDSESLDQTGLQSAIFFFFLFFFCGGAISNLQHFTYKRD
jgi:hypothetical protein